MRSRTSGSRSSRSTTPTPRDRRRSTRSSTPTRPSTTSRTSRSSRSNPSRKRERPSLHDKEGHMPPKAWSAKRERQYEHIKDSLEDRGSSEDKAEEIAARTVNKERARAGE